LSGEGSRHDPVPCAWQPDSDEPLKSGQPVWRDPSTRLSSDRPCFSVPRLRRGVHRPASAVLRSRAGVGVEGRAAHPRLRCRRCSRAGAMGWRA